MIPFVMLPLEFVKDLIIFCLYQKLSVKLPSINYERFEPCILGINKI